MMIIRISLYTRVVGAYDLCAGQESKRAKRKREFFEKKKNLTTHTESMALANRRVPAVLFFFFFLVVTEKYDTRSRPRLPSTDKTKMRKYKKKIRRPCILLYGQVVITRVRVRIRRGDGGARGSSVSSGAAGVEGET